MKQHRISFMKHMVILSIYQKALSKKQPELKVIHPESFQFTDRAEPVSRNCSVETGHSFLFFFYFMLNVT